MIVIKLVPGFDDESIGALITYSSSLKALVLELFGTGNGPAKRQSLLDSIELAHNKGSFVVTCSLLILFIFNC